VDRALRSVWDALSRGTPVSLPQVRARAAGPGPLWHFTVDLHCGVPGTNWTRRVPRPVLTGHAASLTPYVLGPDLYLVHAGCLLFAQVERVAL
jgi:hypothetical protein